MSSVASAASALQSQDEEDDEESPAAYRRKRHTGNGRRQLGAVFLGAGLVFCLCGVWGLNRGIGPSAHAATERETPKPKAASMEGLAFDGGMLASPSDMVMEDYAYQPYCRDTPNWANGYDCVSEGKTAEEGCTSRGWSCAGYALKGFCRDGQRKARQWAFGKGVNYPELNCCVCGGNEDLGGSCKKLGCSIEYRSFDPCQCNAGCVKHMNCCYDYEAVCVKKAATEYRPRDTSLLYPSDAPAHTFYMYRAQTAESFPPTNVNTASLGAVIWYLHNEIVNKCPRRGTIVSKNDITRILRYKVTVKATTPLLDRGMNFGVKSSYDYGASTGPGNRYGEDWSKYGYFVGCVVVGHWPHESFASALAYPQPYWYSLPGKCPNEDVEHKDPDCVKEEPGGYCKDPTGAGNCTYTYEEAGEINIDELVGISPRWTHEEFCRRGCQEYDPRVDRGHCLHWWDLKWDMNQNRGRVRDADEMFARKYPDMPRDREIPPPPCDFDKENFYRDFMPKPP